MPQNCSLRNQYFLQNLLEAWFDKKENNSSFKSTFTAKQKVAA